VNAYIPAMEKLAEQKRNWRLDAAFAALDVAGRGGEVPIMEGFLPPEHRRYLHHDPNADGQDALGSDRLNDLLCKEKIPFSVDLDRSSEKFGVRYIAAAANVPKNLSLFAEDPAKISWEAWKKDQVHMKGAVSDLLHASTNFDPASVEGSLASRVNSRASEMRVTKPARSSGAKASAERD